MFYPENKQGINVEATSKRINEMLIKNDVSTKMLAKAMNLSEQSVSKWRHGRSLPEIQNCYVLSRMLGVKMDDLIVGFDEVVSHFTPNPPHSKRVEDAPDKKSGSGMLFSNLEWILVRPQFAGCGAYL